MAGASLAFEAPLAAVKARLAAGEDVFRPLVRRCPRRSSQDPPHPVMDIQRNVDGCFLDYRSGKRPPPHRLSFVTFSQILLIRGNLLGEVATFLRHDVFQSPNVAGMSGGRHALLCYCGAPWRDLLDNPHRVTVELRPDPAYDAAREAAEAARLRQLKEAMTPEDLQAVMAVCSITITTKSGRFFPPHPPLMCHCCVWFGQPLPFSGPRILHLPCFVRPIMFASSNIGANLGV